MLQTLGCVEMGPLPGGEGCLASTVRTRYGGRCQSQDGPERSEPELSPSQRVNAGLAAQAARWVGDKDWAGLELGACAGAAPPACSWSCKSWWEISLTSLIKGGETPSRKVQYLQPGSVD